MRAAHACCTCLLPALFTGHRAPCTVCPTQFSFTANACDFCAPHATPGSHQQQPDRSSHSCPACVPQAQQSQQEEVAQAPLWFTTISDFKPLEYGFHGGRFMLAQFACSLRTGEHFVMKRYRKRESARCLLRLAIVTAPALRPPPWWHACMASMLSSSWPSIGRPSARATGYAICLVELGF
jgi:hypothetical protein